MDERAAIPRSPEVIPDGVDDEGVFPRLSTEAEAVWKAGLSTGIGAFRASHTDFPHIPGQYISIIFFKKNR